MAETFDPDKFLAEEFETTIPAGDNPPQGAITTGLEEKGFDPDEFLAEEYGTVPQQALTALEGISEGIAGPLAPLIETKVFGVDPEEIRARREENPVSFGAGQVTGLVGSAFTPIPGMGAGLTAAGKIAQKAAGLAAPISTTAKIGSAIVREAAESAILQGSDEVSKLILQDPNVSAETAIGNIGLAAALGGAASGVFTGAVSPLWKATAGKGLEKMLGKVTDTVNSTEGILSKDVMDASGTLGIDLAPLEKAIVSNKPVAKRFATDLGYGQNEQAMQAFDNIRKKVDDSVLAGTGKTADQIIDHSEAVTGRTGMETLKKELRDLVEPVSKEFKSLEEPFRGAKVLVSRKNQIAEDLNKLALDNSYLNTPKQKFVDKTVEALEKAETAEDLKKLVTFVGNLVEDQATESRVARQVKDILLKAQQDTLGEAIGKEAPELFQKYINARKEYAKVAKIGDDIADTLSLKHFEGVETLIKRLEESRSPEQFLNRLSPANNAELLPWMQATLPKTIESIRQNELAGIIKPHVARAAQGKEINVLNLKKSINSLSPEMRQFAVPEELLAKIHAADTLLNAIPKRADSGTPGGLARVFSRMWASGLGAVAGVIGGNPLAGAIMGELAHQVGKKWPEEVKLAYLKFLGSDKQINASGFKAMVDYFDQVAKGEAILAKGAKAVFKRSAEVLATNRYPTDKDREKIDKKVSQLQDAPNPEAFASQSDMGHYLEDHQVAIATTTARAMAYLSKLKPQKYRASPLDREVPPSKEAVARYNRALDIAQEPNLLLERIQKGTLQLSDIQDIDGMYPGLRARMANKLTEQMMRAMDDEETIPQVTRQSLSLFLGQPLDSSMLPASIQSAQIAVQPQVNQNQGPGKSMKALDKVGKNYETPLQDRSKRD